jgi:hydrogenase-4 membrane subunit HyfE
MKQRILAVLAYVLPTFPLGYFWHLTVFADYYKSLDVYRDDIVIPFGVISMLIQGIVWSIIYERMFAGESIAKGAVKFAALAFPLAWSFMALAVSAKHRMSSAGGYLLIETAFILVHYAIVSPLIAAVYARRAD